MFKGRESRLEAVHVIASDDGVSADEPVYHDQSEVGTVAGAQRRGYRKRAPAPVAPADVESPPVAPEPIPAPAPAPETPPEEPARKRRRM